MPLYGNELGPDVTPFEAGLGRVVKFDKPGDFVGREALAAAPPPDPSAAGRADPSVPPDRPARLPCSRRRERLRDRHERGPVPTLGVPIAMAYLEPGADADDHELSVGIRGDALLPSY